MRSLIRGVRLSFSLLTAWRVDVPPPTLADARVAMAFAPVVGFVIGAVAAFVTWAVRDLTAYDASPVFAGVCAIGTIAVATRALHLDGLADTADGLGSLRGPEEAIALMKQGTVGPFGVVVLVLVLLTQVGAYAASVTIGRATIALVFAVITGRLAATMSVTPRTPVFDVGGLGALVDGSVPSWLAWGWAVVVTAGAFAGGNLDDRRGLGGGLHAALAVVAGLAAAHVLRARAVRRFGGVNGDVLGAQVEVATMVTLIVFALNIFEGR
ncbi:MAG: adenosylcobinamide-GDP ribazoletransferase [Frankiaceae bacterium]|nr:adenosylcobinamide-GDP ribazoletransferase [Frankiaceae bacterium]